MKFLTLENGQLGALLDETVVDVVAAARELSPGLRVSTLESLLQAGDSTAAAIWTLAQQALAAGVACRPLAEVRPMAPIPVPQRNILCLGKNYLEHAQEIAAKMKQSSEAPREPIFFTKATTAVIGPGAPIPAYPAYTRKLDYEAELALVIGKGGRDIAAGEAWEHVFGYTAMNDVSARDLQKNHHQWFRAKSLDGFAPMGPLLVHRSVMPEPANIEIKCFVNGELRQSDTFDRLIFDVPTIISTLSAGMTLLPGDIIATGTPAGVGMGFTPPKYLQPGDEVVVDVTGVGELRNPVIA
ncbi:MAG: fumarylacetoacetate hydrolase family protein [Gammaproteobacteria bacterium]|jgi:2-keto-4-pentenoate hydratase/2-oxohepta-3-ene-1,7-dioic acid hydratase in catechol pathway|nr:fumarylacetoacetate hydrolase family protein [Gammaproteobacteria bacterium]